MVSPTYTGLYSYGHPWVRLRGWWGASTVTKFEERVDELANARASKQVSEMHEAEVLQFLRQTAISLNEAVTRLEKLVEPKEGT